MIRVNAAPVFASVVKCHPNGDLTVHVRPCRSVRKDEVPLAGVLPSDLRIPVA